MTGSTVGWVRPLNRLSIPVLRRPMLADALLAVVVVLTALPRTVSPDHVRGPEFVVSVALAAPLVWRRRAPITVFGAICLVAFVQWLGTGPVFADLALLIAFCTVAATSSVRRTLV